MLAMLAELRPAVEALLGDGAEGAVEVWVRELEGEHLTRSGFTERGGRKRPIVHLQSASAAARTTLAHELVHALYAERLRDLPPLLEEGVADWVAERVAPAADEHARPSKHVHVAAYFDALRLSLELPDAERDGAARTLELELRLAGEPDLLPPETLFAACDWLAFREQLESAGRLRSARFYALAELCVERIVERYGLGALGDLIDRASAIGLDCVPWPWIAQAAGLEHRQDWLDAAWSRLTPADVRWLAETQPGLIVAPLASMCVSILQPLFPAAHGAELLRKAKARLVFATGEPLLLADLEPLAATLDAIGAAASSTQAPSSRN